MISFGLSAHIVGGVFVFSTCFAMYFFGVLSSLAERAVICLFILCVCWSLLFMFCSDWEQ